MADLFLRLQKCKMTIHSSTHSSIHPVTELPHGPGTQQDSGNSRSNKTENR